MLGLSSRESGYTLTGTALVVSMGMEMRGTMPKKQLPFQEDQCHLSSGMSAMCLLNIVSHVSQSGPRQQLTAIPVYVKDPPLWSLNIMNGTNMWFDDILNNATAVNAPYGTNWVQNTDGFDTMDTSNIMLTNMVYQGGDDCIAIKPRSYNIFVQNVPDSLLPNLSLLLIRK
jgi:hypothetical protein